MENQPETARPSERRRYPRYPVTTETFAFFGEGTCMVVDISRGGLALHCTVLTSNPVTPVQLELFTSHPQFYLAGLPVALVSEFQTVPATLFSQVGCKRMGLQFDSLSSEQQQRIDDFIAQLTTREQ